MVSGQRSGLTIVWASKAVTVAWRGCLLVVTASAPVCSLVSLVSPQSCATRESILHFTETCQTFLLLRVGDGSSLPCFTLICVKSERLLVVSGVSA